LEEFLKESAEKTFVDHWIPNETFKTDEEFISLKIEPSGVDTTIEYKNAA